MDEHLKMSHLPFNIAGHAVVIIPSARGVRDPEKQESAREEFQTELIRLLTLDTGCLPQLHCSEGGRVRPADSGRASARSASSLKRRFVLFRGPVSPHPP